MIRSISLILLMNVAGTCFVESTSERGAVIAELNSLQGTVGEWRGAGQVKRGSAQGAWRESLQVIWAHQKDSSGMVWKIETGSFWKAAKLSFNPEKKAYVLAVTLKDDATRDFTGTWKEKSLILESQPDEAKMVYRATLNFINEDRFTLLTEKRPESGTFFARIAEVAYQRQGTRLAAVNGNKPECVVTGGEGTIEVSYQGKKYYVCCSGCKEAFNADPAGILAEWEKKRQAKKTGSR